MIFSKVPSPNCGAEANKSAAVKRNKNETKPAADEFAGMKSLAGPWNDFLRALL